MTEGSTNRYEDEKWKKPRRFNRSSTKITEKHRVFIKIINVEKFSRTKGTIWLALSNRKYNAGHYVLFKICSSYIKKKMKKQLWLVWLSGLSMGLWTKGPPTGFPVRAHAWVVGQVSSRGQLRGNNTLMFLSLSFPSPALKINK